MFDWIPTIGEVARKVVCTLSDHDWIRVVDQDRNFLYYQCSECGKVKK